MKRHYRALLEAAVLASISTILLATLACNFGNREPVGETQTESKTVLLGNAKAVIVDVKMAAGELKLSGGSTSLLDADFTYNVPSWKPEVQYDTPGSVGHLTIRQPEGSHSHSGNTRNEWEVHLNSAVPMQLNVDQGAGKTNLDLAGMDLNNLKVDIGAGETTVNLDGNWKNNLQASIQGGVGKATLILPRDVGVRVVAHGGLGAINASSGLTKDGDAYVNDAYGKSPITLRITVEGGVGEIDLQLGGGGGAV